MDGQTKAFALSLIAPGVFRDKTQSPEGLGFRLKLHDTHPDAPLSPYYLDFRRLRGSPDAMYHGAYLLLAKSPKPNYDLLADVPIAISPIVGVMSHISRIPMVTPREAKTHGTGATVEGIYTLGQRVVLFDDLITTAKSKLVAVEALRGVGLQVEHCVVFADREQGGREELAAAGITLHAAFTVTELLGFYLEQGVLAPMQYQEIVEYIANN